MVNGSRALTVESPVQLKHLVHECCFVPSVEKAINLRNQPKESSNPLCEQLHVIPEWFGRIIDQCDQLVDFKSTLRPQIELGDEDNEPCEFRFCDPYLVASVVPNENI